MPPTVPSQRCFVGNGTEYRGVASTAASGLSCLAWNSDLLYQELHVDSVGAAALLGLGPHAYCRSAMGPQTICTISPMLLLGEWGGGPSGVPSRGSPRSPGPGPTRLSMHPRNPDKDERPWCYVVNGSALSWEYCRLVACGA